MALAADMVMSQFGTRNRLYERLQSGEPDALRKRLSADYKDDAPLQRVQRFIAAMDSPVKT
jgi:aromatic ring hydroxylase